MKEILDKLKLIESEKPRAALLNKKFSSFRDMEQLQGDASISTAHKPVKMGDKQKGLTGKLVGTSEAVENTVEDLVAKLGSEFKSQFLGDKTAKKDRDLANAPADKEIGKKTPAKDIHVKESAGQPSDNDAGTTTGGAKMTLGQWKQMWMKKMPNADFAAMFKSPPNMQGSAIAYFDGWMNNPDARWDPLPMEGSLNEFAPGSGDDGEEENLHKYARMWYNGDESTQEQVEQILDRMGWEIGEIESEEGGAFVVQSGDEHGDSYIGFAVDDLTEAMSEGEQRVDSLVTDSLKIMQGAEVADAVKALKTVLGDREYNSRRGHYNFYIRQMMDMYSQQGMAEDATKEPAPNSSLAHYMKKRAELANKKGLGEEGELDEVLGFVIGQPKQAKKPAVSLATMRKEFEKERPETIQKTVRGNDDPKNVKYVRTVAAEAGRYGSNNPDTMSPNNYDRYQQDQMDHSKRDFKRREHEHEWEQEKAYSDKLAARDGGSWYIRINGKVLKDKQQQPYTFQGKAAANKAALTMMAKAFNKGKKFTLTTSDTDAVATQPIAESAVPTKPKHRRW